MYRGSTLARKHRTLPGSVILLFAIIFVSTLQILCTLADKMAIVMSKRLFYRSPDNRYCQDDLHKQGIISLRLTNG